MASFAEADFPQEITPEIREGLRRVRVMRALIAALVIAPIIVTLAVVAATLRNPENARQLQTLLLIALAVTIPPALFLGGATRCPRCHRAIFQNYKINPFRRSCQHCGLPID